MNSALINQGNQSRISSRLLYVYQRLPRQVGLRSWESLGFRRGQHLVGERRSCPSTMGEVAGAARCVQPRCGEGSAGAEQPRGQLSKAAHSVGLCREGVGWSGVSAQRASGWRSGTEPAGSATGPTGSPAAAARPPGSPALRSSPGRAAAQKPQSVAVDPQLRVGKIKLRKGETLFQVGFEGLGLVIKSIRSFRRVLARRLSRPCSPTGGDRYNLPWGQSTRSPRVSAAAGPGPAPYLVPAASAHRSHREGTLLPPVPSARRLRKGFPGEAALQQPPGLPAGDETCAASAPRGRPGDP